MVFTAQMLIIFGRLGQCSLGLFFLSGRSSEEKVSRQITQTNNLDQLELFLRQFR